MKYPPGTYVARRRCCGEIVAVAFETTRGLDAAEGVREFIAEGYVVTWDQPGGEYRAGKPCACDNQPADVPAGSHHDH